ncbi:protein-L-histidine N-pros-methyltransferase isoform X2 [Zophobas morio]|uniref:protein-L-histidine N-pros-methyltransferase isoform X2 n=1 Tax=Zophobas morio TaxID=2755281 RepID=UPI003082CE33
MLFEKCKVMLSVQWYHCDLSKLPPDLSSKFVELGPDDDTIKFLQQSEEKSDWVLTQIWHSIVKVFLGWFMTQTSINGWLQRGSMFVLSLQQFLKLMKVNEKWHKGSLLDLGAGDGEVTAHLSALFDKTYVTEVSTTMRNLLQNRGYKLLEIDTWQRSGPFDVISCLNLIDRCDTPNQLLKQMKTSLKPDGLVLLAVVLPFSAYVEAGSRGHKPTELLPILGSCFEDQVNSVVHDVLTPAGFKVVSWTRVPYLCEGDLQQSYYWLDDVVFILKAAN